MSKCPFWSSKRKKVECDEGCPMLNTQSCDDDDRCVFCECSTDDSMNIDLQALMKEEYSFMNVATY